MKTAQQLVRVKQVHQLSDELHAICTNVANEDIDWSELPGILEARVMKNCPDMVSLSSKIKQLCLEINERTDDEIIHGLTDEILSLTK